MGQPKKRITPELLMQRLSFWKDTLWHLGAKIVGALYVLVTTAQWLRDSFVPQKYHDYLVFIPSWSWRTWLIIGLALGLVIALEGSYRIFAKTQIRLNDLLSSEFPDIGIEPFDQLYVREIQDFPEGSGRDGILFAVFAMKVFNRSNQAATIEIVLEIILENKERFHLWAEGEAPSMDVLAIKEEPLPRLINLGAKEGTSGYVMFFLPRHNLEFIRGEISGADLEYLKKQNYAFLVRERITNTAKVFSHLGEALEFPIE